jgi:hypothetical protein
MKLAMWSFARAKRDAKRTAHELAGWSQKCSLWCLFDTGSGRS